MKENESYAQVTCKDQLVGPALSTSSKTKKNLSSTQTDIPNVCLWPKIAQCPYCFCGAIKTT